MLRVMKEQISSAYLADRRHRRVDEAAADDLGVRAGSGSRDWLTKYFDKSFAPLSEEEAKMSDNKSCYLISYRTTTFTY